MKRAYWFLVLLGIWCTACAIWYMFGVKGIPIDPAHFTPHPRMVAIVEILVMLLIACLIGYGIGWGLREGPMDELRESLNDLDSKYKGLAENAKESTQQLEKNRQLLRQVQQSARSEIDAAKVKASTSAKELAIVRAELAKARESAADRSAAESLENESNGLRIRASQLEFQKKELEETIAKLRHEIELAISLQARRPEPTHPFVRPVDEDEKDDLTVIKGIGPFIEKRLNMVGIYTLRQISEFTPQTIEQVTKAIEFFPNRMINDDWVGQAKRLVQ